MFSFRKLTYSTFSAAEFKVQYLIAQLRSEKLFCLVWFDKSMRYQSYYIVQSTLPQMAQWFRHEIAQLLDEKVTLFTGFLIMKIISLVC